jgi:SAM-dependent methyltransferase
MSVMYPKVHERAHAVVADIVGLSERKGEWVLDCGAGDRHLSRLIEAHGLRVVAVDPRGGSGVVKAGWERLPFRDGSLSAVTACASFHYAESPRAALLEASRALKPGGQIVVALSPIHQGDAGARRGEQTARERTGNPRYRHLSLPEVKRDFRDAGLDLEIRRFRVGGFIGLVRAAKSAAGVDLAEFPMLVGRKRAD